MPVIRYRSRDGRPVETVLEHLPGGEGRMPPLTLGSAPESPSHVSLADAALPAEAARILGSGAGSSAYAYVLLGDRLRINGSPLGTFRVLRHGDSFAIGATGFLYLDFAIRPVPERTSIAECVLGAACVGPTRFGRGDEYVACPWCGKTYHDGCWLGSEKCVTGNCYPIRRMLLAEMAGKVRVTKMTDEGPMAARLCAARCTDRDARTASAPIAVGDDIIRCPDSRCQRPYHPGCWLSHRGTCRECARYDIAATIGEVVFRDLRGEPS